MSDPLKNLWGVAKRRVPQLTALLIAFLRRDANAFYQISQSGSLSDRIAITVAAGTICALTAVAAAILLALEQPPNLFDVGRAGAIIALTAVLFAVPSYFILRRWAQGPSLFFFTNVGIAIGTLTLALPPLILAAGFWISPGFQRDFTRLEGGRAEGTGVHAYYCGTIEDRAALFANGEELIRNSAQLAANNEWLTQDTAYIDREGRRIVALGEEARSHPNDLQRWRTFEATRQKFLKGRIAAYEKQKENMLTLEAGLEIMRRGLDISNRTTLAPLRLAAAYPILASFFIIGAVAGSLVWLAAFLLVWRFVVSHHGNRGRRRRAALTLAVTGLGLMATIGIARSGYAEFFAAPLPSRDALLQSIQYDFEQAATKCGRLNSYGLW